MTKQMPVGGMVISTFNVQKGTEYMYNVIEMQLYNAKSCLYVYVVCKDLFTTQPGLKTT